MKNLRKLATGHSRDYLVTIGSLGYLKLVKSDMYPKFLKINFVVVVRHSANGSERPHLQSATFISRFSQMQIVIACPILSFLPPPQSQSPRPALFTRQLQVARWSACVLKSCNTFAPICRFSASRKQIEEEAIENRKVGKGTRNNRVGDQDRTGAGKSRIATAQSPSFVVSCVGGEPHRKKANAQLPPLLSKHGWSVG